MLEIRYDDKKIKQLERELQDFPKNSLPKVMSRGLNRTAEWARTQAVNAIAEKKKIKAGGVRKFITLRKATYKNWRSALEFSTGRFILMDLNPTKTTTGIRYTNPLTGKRISIPGAFKAKMSSGHKGIFIRGREHIRIRKWIPMGKAHALKKYGTEKKEAIYELMGPTSENLFLSRLKGKIERIQKESLGRLEKNIHDQVQLILKARLPA